jgi:hypothetical protein
MKVLLLLLLAVAPLSANDIRLIDDREHWTIGVAAFEGRDLSQENEYLTRSFPLLLRERLEAIPEHYFGEAEVRAYQLQILTREQQRLAASVNADRRARDELFFAARADSAAAYEERIAAALGEINALREVNPEEIHIQPNKPIQFVSGADGELVFDKEVLSPYQLAKQQDLDALLWGRFEEVQGFLYFEVTLFNAVLGEPVFTYSDAAAPIELYELADGLVAELATVLWGRDWSSLTVQTDPPGASVWIDDQFQGRTPLSIPYLLPGTRQMRVQIPEYQSVARTIELPPYTDQVQRITLLPQSGETFGLASDPAGAEVYRGAEWLGTTPLSVEKPKELDRLMLRREGFLDFPFYADSAVEESVTAELLPQDDDPKEIQDHRRHEMYRAFGAFALSLPLPLFVWTYWQDYEALGRDTPFLAYAPYAYAGTFVVSSALFVNLAIRLLRYIRAADRKA